jgi:hypothetical protein
VEEGCLLNVRLQLLVLQIKLAQVFINESLQAPEPQEKNCTADEKGRQITAFGTNFLCVLKLVFLLKLVAQLWCQNGYVI